MNKDLESEMALLIRAEFRQEFSREKAEDRELLERSFQKLIEY